MELQMSTPEINPSYNDSVGVGSGEFGFGVGQTKDLKPREGFGEQRHTVLETSVRYHHDQDATGHEGS
jgi:hypothetical protein